MTELTAMMGAAPAIVPASVLADAGAATATFLRLAQGADPAPIQRLVAVAIGMAEAFLGQALVLRGFEDVLSARGMSAWGVSGEGVSGEGVVAEAGWRRLATAPVRAIAGVTALPTGAAPSVLPVAAYRIDIDGDGVGWVRVTDGTPLVAVAYAAGLAADWASLPAPIAQGVVMLAASLFTDGQAGAPPGVIALWRPFRRLRLGGVPR